MSLLSSAKSALSSAASSAAGDLAGSVTGAASKLTYSQLKTTYMDFESPQAAIFLRIQHLTIQAILLLMKSTWK